MTLKQQPSVQRCLSIAPCILNKHYSLELCFSIEKQPELSSQGVVCVMWPRIETF